MCVYNNGVCIAVVLWLHFLFLFCIMRRKCIASISVPLTWRRDTKRAWEGKQTYSNGVHGWRHQHGHTYWSHRRPTARNGPICWHALVFYLVFVQWFSFLVRCYYKCMTSFKPASQCPCSLTSDLHFSTRFLTHHHTQVRQLHHNPVTVTQMSFTQSPKQFMSSVLWLPRGFNLHLLPTNKR